MGSSHFASLSRRPPSRNAYKQPLTRPPLYRSESIPLETQAQAKSYALDDSSDDEIAIPMMKFSAYTNALLNDAAPVAPSPPKPTRISPEPEYRPKYTRGGSVSRVQEQGSPNGSRVHSPFPRRVIRLSGTPGGSTLRKAKSVSAALQMNVDEAPLPQPESPLDLSTPAQVPRTVRIPVTRPGSHGASFGSSGRISSRINSASREENQAPTAEEYPSTVARSHLADSQGSVSRYGASTVGRTRYAEEAGLQSSMRTKTTQKITGTFLRGPARRGRRRMEDDEQSPVDEKGDALDSGPSSQEPQSQESQEPESQVRSSQESPPNRGSFYQSSFRDFASGSPISSKDVLNSVLRSRSPPPPTLTSSQRSSAGKAIIAQQAVQPIFKVPAPRPDLPSGHDQENEAPPTFKRNKQAPLIHLDKMEKVPVRPETADLVLMRAATPSERKPLSSVNQNTPRRPAPPPPKMSILDAATSTAGAATTTNAGGKRNRLRVNGKHFTRLDCIGRGGSSRVYRVMAENSKFFALKRVSLEDADEMAVVGFKGEIDLLKKLEGVERVIRLYDYELNEEKGTLSVVSRFFMVICAFY